MGFKALPQALAEPPSKEIKAGCRIVAIVLGLVSAWGSRFAMNSDGISYLEIGDAFFRRDWAAAVNSYWSPLYPCLMKLVLAILRPEPYWEAPAAHLANFLIYLAALACLEWFLAELIAHRQALDWEGEKALPHSALWLVAYAVFVHVALKDIGLRRLTPDLCVAGALLALGGFALRARNRARGLSQHAALGAAAGVGYLFKAILFPVAFVFIAMSVAADRGSLRQALGRGLAALAAFGLIAAGQIAGIHWKTGRWTFSDNARLNSARFICGIGNFPHWQGESPACGVPVNAPRVINAQPAVYEFATPMGGSYPLWSEHAYWYEGARSPFNPRRQMLATRRALRTGYRYLIGAKAALISILSFFFLFSDRRRLGARLAAQAVLWIPAVCGVALYMLVYVEARYLGPFIALLFMALFSAVSAPRFLRSRAVFIGVFAATAVALAAVTAYSLPDATWRMFLFHKKNEQWAVAAGVLKLGLRPGDFVATVGSSAGVSIGGYWARLAQLRIVAESPSPKKFWSARPGERERALEAFRAAGVKLVLAWGVPPEERHGGWKNIAGTGYYAFPLRKN